MTPLKLAAGLAAAIVVAVVGYSLLPKGPSIGGPATPTPAAQPSVQPSAAPSSTPIVDLPEGRLPGGRYRIQPGFGASPTLAIVADVPAGWFGIPSFRALADREDNNKPVSIVFMLVDGLFSDPCHWDLDGTGAAGQPGDVEVGPTVDDLVAALRSQQASYTSSTPRPVTFGLFNGTELELQLPGDDVLSTCDIDPGDSPDSGGSYYVFSGEETGGIYAQGPDNRWQLFIVDVGGTRLITLLRYFEETSQADLEAARAIVESFEITP